VEFSIARQSEAVVMLSMSSVKLQARALYEFQELERENRAVLIQSHPFGNFDSENLQQALQLRERQFA
jgi:hypothetical protein